MVEAVAPCKLIKHREDEYPFIKRLLKLSEIMNPVRLVAAYDNTRQEDD
jgi:hypothetical protein